METATSSSAALSNEFQQRQPSLSGASTSMDVTVDTKEAAVQVVVRWFFFLPYGFCYRIIFFP